MFLPHSEGVCENQLQAPLSANIPEVFCWTKMGTEAGQPLDSIMRRKELERRSSNGAFTWGIGNSLGGAATLAKSLSPSGEVDVLFTRMKSAAKAADVTPSSVVLWLGYYDAHGNLVDLPGYSLVTSRGSAEKRSHYALLCHSSSDITSQIDLGAFDATYARNLASSNPIGASQVTSVVRYDVSAPTDFHKPYHVAFRAKLWEEGFVRLGAPVTLSGDLANLYRETCNANSVEDWCIGVKSIRALAKNTVEKKIVQSDFFKD